MAPKSGSLNNPKISLASKRVKARLFSSPFNRDAIRTPCHKTPKKSMANEAQLGAINIAPLGLFTSIF